jgi:hypothetical protein
MSREEILKVMGEWIGASHEGWQVDVYGKEDAAEELEKLFNEDKEQECIGFHKFIKSHIFHYDYRGETFNRISEKYKFYTHKELYQLYLQDKNKTQ